MNAIAPALPEIALAEMPAWLIGELRSDHAGETGAVMIYRGLALWRHAREKRGSVMVAAE